MMLSRNSIAITVQLVSLSSTVMAVRSISPTFHVQAFSFRRHVASSAHLSGVFSSCAFSSQSGILIPSTHQHPILQTKTSHHKNTWSLNRWQRRPNQAPIGVGSTCLFSSPSDDDIESSTKTNPGAKETSIIEDAQNIATLVGAQALLIPISIALANFLELPNRGLGSSFVLGNAAFVEGAQWTIPLFVLAGKYSCSYNWTWRADLISLIVFNPGIMKLIEPYSPALQNVTRATQRSVLAVMGPKRRPIFAVLVSILLGAVAGWG
jgi:hypothetical protein